jgi:hypothetical protein
MIFSNEEIKILDKELIIHREEIEKISPTLE